MDLKKEIKLSDLFRRKPKGPAEQPVADAPARASGLRKEIRLPFRRRPVDPDFDVGPAKPKGTRAARRRREGGDQPEALPAIPLMRAFDLLPKEGVRQAERRRPSTPQLVLAVAGLVLVAGLASLFLMANTAVADKEQQLAALEEQLAAKELPLEAPKPIGGSDAALIEERNGRTDALANALGSRTAWDRVLRDVSLVLPEDVWLQGLTGLSAAAPAASGATAPPPDPAATPAASTFELRGYTRRHEGVAQLLSRLQVLPAVESATLVSAAATELGKEQVIEFTVSGTIKPHAFGGAA